MKKRNCIAWFLILGLFLSGCTSVSQTNPASTPAETIYGTLDGSFKLKNVEPVLLKYEDIDFNTTQAARIVERINAFSKELTQLAAKNGENLLVSPFSVYMTLSCLVAGAEGTTYEQLKAVLYPEGMSDEEFQKGCGDLICMLCRRPEDQNGNAQNGVNPNSTLKIEIASLVCGDQDMPIRDSFAQRAKEYFNADLAAADFKDPAATEAVNEWARLATNGLIEQLFNEPIDPETVLLLANSLYFEGHWKWEFSKEDTKDDTFYGVSKEATVPFMVHDGMQKYCETQLFKATRQYYYGGAYMEIFLPKDGVTVEQIMKAVEEEDLKYSDAKGLLKLPKFNMDDDIPLEDILKELQLDNMFKGGITKIAEDNRELYCTDAFQKSRIEVDEAGTKAAAVTVMVFAETGMMEPNPAYFEMIVNRPFVYRICAQAGQTPQTLFVGIVNNL
ncbi:MAG: serpin family protein [Christensenellales bacterium]